MCEHEAECFTEVCGEQVCGRCYAEEIAAEDPTKWYQPPWVEPVYHKNSPRSGKAARAGEQRAPLGQRGR